MGLYVFGAHRILNKRIIGLLWHPSWGIGAKRHARSLTKTAIIATYASKPSAYRRPGSVLPSYAR